MQAWIQRVAAAVFHEYDRRIKRASLIGDYGAAQHADEATDDDADAVEIVNVPRGTLVAPPSANVP